MANSILDTLGNTPLVQIRKLNPNPRVRILAKMECFNPGGSVKDRIALAMIEAGEKSGLLTHGKTVLEATSGNTGIGLALVCTVRGYRLLLAMSEAVSQERQKILRARGAQLLLTPAHLGTDGAIEEVYRLCREHPEKYFMTDQFNNEANWRAHYEGTATEIWRQTEAEVTMVVATLGTSGTCMGISRRLKELNPHIRIVGVEPYLGHKIQGLKNMKEAYRPGIFDKTLLDEKVNIDDEEAFETARRLTREEGLFVGMSSGAAMAVAARKAADMTEGTLVVIFPDGGERYLSTPLFAVREKARISLHNTMTRSKVGFEPALAEKVSLYSSGPTANDRMHLDECRRVVFTDLICRYLNYRGYDVTHVMHITDLDDKTIEGSQAAGEELAPFTQRNIEAFHRDRSTLGIRPADEYPLASRHVDEMVKVAVRLSEKGYAYEKLRSLYFDISRFGDYGKLSGVDLTKIRVGATVDLDEYEKDNPRDFTLLKRSRLGELKRGIYVKTQWGNVRPSWHLQCAAMAMKTLGEHFDLYAGSRDLVFPHNENVNAIAAALTGKPLARCWLHCERVLVAGKKIAATGPRITVQDLLDEGYSGREIRFWLLSTHYRKPVVYSDERLANARNALKRLDSCVELLCLVTGGSPYPERDQIVYDIRQGFTGAMDDDCNISAAMASIFSVVRKVNALVLGGRLDKSGADKILEALRQVNEVLGVLQFSEAPSDSEIQALIREREAARQAGDWPRADAIRDRLKERGVAVRDITGAGRV